MIASTWEVLPVESKTALTYAWAAAQQRVRTPNAAVDAFDLLVGIILSKPGEFGGRADFSTFRPRGGTGFAG